MSDRLHDDIAELFASFEQREWLPDDGYSIIQTERPKQSRAWDSKSALLRARAKGLCLRCRSRSSPPKPGKTHCTACLGKIAAWQSGNGRDLFRAAQKRYRVRRHPELVAARVCTSCRTRPARDHRRTCARCLESARVRYASRNP